MMMMTALTVIWIQVRNSQIPVKKTTNGLYGITLKQDKVLVCLPSLYLMTWGLLVQITHNSIWRPVRMTVTASFGIAHHEVISKK